MSSSSYEEPEHPNSLTYADMLRIIQSGNVTEENYAELLGSYREYMTGYALRNIAEPADLEDAARAADTMDDVEQIFERNKNDPRLIQNPGLRLLHDMGGIAIETHAKIYNARIDGFDDELRRLSE